MMSRISPVVFFIFRIWCIRYQNCEAPVTSLGANTFIRYTGGLGSFSVGALRPTTWYWRIATIYNDDSSKIPKRNTHKATDKYNNAQVTTGEREEGEIKHT